jgi:hypothetical protein
MAKHNKKRNVGLLHEQLVRHASEMTVQGNKGKATETIDILMKHFCEGSEMLKEFRLFSSLIHTRVSSADIARRIIEESKKACENHNPANLMKEKSALIKDINHTLDRQDFYDQRIKDYKIFSTVQALLYEWRGRSSLSPEERVQYELVLESHLTSTLEEETLEKIENADPLVLNIMVEKFNKKVVQLSQQIKEKATLAVEDYFQNCDNKFLTKKKVKLVENISRYRPDSTDESIAKALSLSSLLNELEVEDDR